MRAGQLFPGVFPRCGHRPVGKPGVEFANGPVDRHGSRHHRRRQQDAEADQVGRRVSPAPEGRNGRCRNRTDGGISRDERAHRHVEHPDQLKHRADHQPGSRVAEHPPNERAGDDRLIDHELPRGRPVEPEDPSDKSDAEYLREQMHIECRHRNDRFKKRRTTTSRPSCSSGKNDFKHDRPLTVYRATAVSGSGPLVPRL